MSSNLKRLKGEISDAVKYTDRSQGLFLLQLLEA